MDFTKINAPQGVSWPVLMSMLCHSVTEVEIREKNMKA
jgi:hypothetical protein